MTKLLQHLNEPKIAYFSMEIGLRDDIPTYSGGLGVLAGDTVKSSADLNLPFVAVTLVSRKGYFRQEIDENGIQKELPAQWNPSALMDNPKERVSLTIENRTVHIQAWIYYVESPRGGSVPVMIVASDGRVMGTCAVAFSKLSRMITVAAREGGGSPDANAKLRLALDKELRLGSPSGSLDFLSTGTGSGYLFSSHSAQGKVLMTTLDGCGDLDSIDVGESLSHSRLWLI